MALTTIDLENLQAAMASGELEVEMDGRRVKFASADDLAKRIAYVQGVLTTASMPGAGAPGARRSVFRFAFTTQRGD